MYKQKIILAILSMLLLMSMPGIALAYNMLTADELKIRLDTKVPTILLDIQKKTAYLEHHFYGSVRTFAYPAKNDKDLESAIQGVRMHEQTGNEIVIIGPRGGRPSQRTVDYLVTRGVPEEKIFILEGGIRDWPHREMLLDIKGGCK
ncbi:MAG: rhodanese-like domain-containing protein [Desulfobulbaceae bacterium]|nr:rhodanese-like domain-containing protein [Desulfobulbaceae bacterium]